VDEICSIFKVNGATIYLVDLEAVLEERLERNKTPNRLEQQIRVCPYLLLKHLAERIRLVRREEEDGMRKYIFSFIIIYTSLTSSLFPNKALAVWAYLFVVWDGYIYVISDEYVTEVEEEIGRVTMYSTHEGTYSGNFSNAYSEGTKYYSIKDVPTDEAIAVQDLDEKYKMAFRKGKYAGAIEGNKNDSGLNEESSEAGKSVNQRFELNSSILWIVLLAAIIIGFPLTKSRK
jgi:hypothetical protein